MGIVNTVLLFISFITVFNIPIKNALPSLSAPRTDHSHSPQTCRYKEDTHKIIFSGKFRIQNYVLYTATSVRGQGWYICTEKKNREEVYLNVSNGTFLVVQWLRLHASNAGGAGSIPGRGAKSQHAARHGQKNF